MKARFRIEHGYWKHKHSVEPTTDYHGNYESLKEAVAAYETFKTNVGSWQIIEEQYAHIADGVFDWESTERFWDEHDIEEL